MTLKQSFDSIDENGYGHITRKQFETFLTSIDQNFTQKDIKFISKKFLIQRNYKNKRERDQNERIMKG
jgi:Ca2+-binding EF-hand superfamily protein